MKNSVSGNVHFIKLDRGEDVLENVVSYINEKNINAGVITALGVLKEIEIGYYELEKAKYVTKYLKDDHELLSLSGNVGELNGKKHPHIHVVLGDKDLNCSGGHLLKAKVGVTCELFISASDMKLERIFSDEVKLNLLSPKL